MRHCEVTVLQWLSGDERLKELLDSGKDLHEEIYRLVTGDQNITEAKRDKSKLMFLPVMYGCGARTLAEQIHVPEEVARELIRRIHALFPTARKWLQTKHEEAKVGPVKDYFGRPRRYEEHEAYLVQNFVVQGVAATVCLEKLVEIYRALRGRGISICFTIHDGYGFVVTPDQAVSACKIIKPILESESKLCPGLKLKAQYKYGASLNAMTVLGK
jgi:DNA polymerase I-like protein with 3'-5' exonuclease and polymerase domains